MFEVKMMPILIDFATKLNIPLFLFLEDTSSSVHNFFFFLPEQKVHKIENSQNIKEYTMKCDFITALFYEYNLFT